MRQLAARLDLEPPADLKRAKGWVGEALERCLGATAATLPEPDFQLLGIELKTLPLSRNGRPKESTYICTVALAGTALRWEDSTVRCKLNRVLWIPVEGDSALPVASRRIGSGFLWSPDQSQERRLRADWEELTTMISLGELEHISSRQGEVLQIRPKGADSRSLVRTRSALGERAATLPRGFYLRATFTREILEQHAGRTGSGA